MPVLTITAALVLAFACTSQAGGKPAVSPDVTVSVANQESQLDPLAIHDNTTGEAFHPATKAEAITLAERLIFAGHRPDLGLMQVNVPANLARLGLTIATAFDPCASIRAGTQVLLDGYEGGATTVKQQAAILRALSRYNTGSATAGLRTYVPAVLASACKVIPALHLANLAPDGPPPEQPPPQPGPAIAASPDVFGRPAAPARELVFTP